MANTNSDHVVRLQADFSDFVRSAKKAGEKSSSLIGKAIEAGIKERSFAGYMKTLKDVEKKRKEIDHKVQALSYATEAKNAGKIDKKLREVAKNLAKLHRELAQEGLDEEIRERKEAERDLFREKSKYLAQLNAGVTEGFEDALRSASEGLGRINAEQIKASKVMNRAVEQQIRGSERMAEFMKIFRRDASKGADDFAEKMHGSLDSLKSSISDMDIGSMLSGGAAGLGKNLGGLAEVAGALSSAGGAMGALAAGLGGVALVLGPLLIAFGLFAGIMFGIDKEVKEFNKSAINTFGTRSVANLGMGNMREGLKTLRHATQDLNKTLGLTSEEAMGVFDAFDAGGISLNRLTQGAVQGAEKEKALGDVLVRTAATARALGVSVNEFAGTLTEYTDTLAMSLDSVTNQFALVSKQAQDAGFSARRFYSLITQASAGQASLNTHLDQTADLLVKMSKTLGEKAAAEVLGGAAGGMKDLSTQDRTRMVMTTGAGRTKGIIERDARSQAANFAEDFTEGLSKSPAAFREALGTASAAGVSVSEEAMRDTTGETLVRELAALSREEQQVLTASFTSSTDKSVSEMGRRLDQLTTVSRGTTGAMFDMTDAMAGLSAGATIAMKLQSASALTGGKSLDELSGPMRMMAESVTGLSGAEYERYAALDRASRGNLSILESMRDNGIPVTEESMADQDKRFGGHIDENGRIVTASGLEVANSTDLLTAMVDRGDAEAAVEIDKNLAVAQESLDETMTISDVLQNEMLVYLRGLYEDFGLPMIDYMADLVHKFIGSGMSREERTGARELRSGLTTGISEASRESAAASRTISKLESKGTDITADEQATLDNARHIKEVSDAVVEASRAALDRLASGDISDLTVREYATDRGVYGSRESAERAAGGGEITEREHRTSGSVAAMRIRSAASRGVGTGPVAAATAAAPADVSAPAAVAPVIVPGASAPTTTPTASARAAEETADAISTPVVVATEEASAVATEHHEASVATMEKIAETSDKNTTKIFTKDKKVGDMLARSNLPDAIVAAQVKHQIAALASAAGLEGEAAEKAVSQYMEEGTFSEGLMSALGGMNDVTRAALSSSVAGLGGTIGGRDPLHPEVVTPVVGSHMRRSEGGTDEASAHAGSEMGEVMHDFIYQGDGGPRGTLTPIDGADTIVGAKAGGPLDRAGGGGGGTVNISIYGGDERRVFDVVKRVLRESGIGPGRVTARA